MIPAIHKTASMPHSWQNDVQFDGITLCWIDEQGSQRTVDLIELRDLIKWNREYVFPTGERITKFVDCNGITDEPVETLIYASYEFLGLIFDFSTKQHTHRMRFFHNGEGKLDW